MSGNILHSAHGFCFSVQSCISISTNQLFINDLTYIIDYARLRLYSDGTTLYLSIRSYHILIKKSSNQELRASLMCFSHGSRVIISINESKSPLFTFGGGSPGGGDTPRKIG